MEFHLLQLSLALALNLFLHARRHASLKNLLVSVNVQPTCVDGHLVVEALPKSFVKAEAFDHGHAHRVEATGHFREQLPVRTERTR